MWRNTPCKRAHTHSTIDSLSCWLFSLDSGAAFPRGSAPAATATKRTLPSLPKPDQLFEVTDTTTHCLLKILSLQEHNRNAESLSAKSTTIPLPPSAKSKGKPAPAKAADPTTTTKPVDLLTFRRLAVDMLLLGVVREINDFDVELSLPDGLSGTLPITAINASYTEALEAANSSNDDDDSDSDSDADADDREAKPKVPPVYECLSGCHFYFNAMSPHYILIG